MPDFHELIVVAEHLLRGRYGSWLNQPDEMALCTFDNSCSPLMWTSPYELRKATLEWTRDGGGGIPQDAALATFHFLNLTDGDPDATWTGTDYDTAEGWLTGFWNDISGLYATDITLTDIRWSADGPAFTPHGDDPHPTLRVTGVGLDGTASGYTSLPPQVAVTVTEVTSAKYTAYGVGVPGSTPGTGTTQIRNRWGRFYLPPPHNTTVVHGRLTSATCETIADAAQDMYVGCAAAELPIVMYSPTTGSSWSVDEVHVDDIYDVVRSRRFVTPLSRHSRSI